MNGTSLQNAFEIARFLARNQVKGEAEKENYIRNVALELGMTRSTVRKKIDFLEDLGVVKRKRKGRTVVIRVNSSVIQEMEFGEDYRGGAVEAW